MRSLVWIGVGAGTALSVLGCDQPLSGSDTCATVTGCASAALTDPDPIWGCVDQTPSNVVQGDGGIVYTTSAVTLNGTLDNSALNGLTATVCSAGDIPTLAQDPTGQLACNMPLVPKFQPPSPSNMEIPLVVPSPIQQGFNFFVAFQNTGVVLPTAIWFNRIPTKSLTATIPIIIIDFVHAAGLAQGLHESLDPTLGLVLLHIYDCTGTPAAGVAATINCNGDGGPLPSTFFAYAIHHGIPLNVTAGGGPLTSDTSGDFGFANVPPGGCTANLYVPSLNNKDIGNAYFVVRPSWDTGVDFRPGAY
jgi:hypothetical protein